MGREPTACANVLRGMRALVGVPPSLALLLVMAAPAAASCAAPASVAENAARAVAVVHGTVTGAGGGAVTLRSDRVLKGSVGGTLAVFVGPGRGGTGGTAVATSVDYAAAVGSDHVLYLIKGADGRLETNACIGSHAGSPTAAEVAYFGAGASSDPASGTTLPQLSPGAGMGSPDPASGTLPSPVPGAAPMFTWSDAAWPALVGVVAAGVLIIFLARRGLEARRGLREKRG